MIMDVALFQNWKYPLGTLHPQRSFLLEEVSGIRFVHKFDDLLLVGGVDGRHRNVPHRSEVAAVVQVLVLQPEKVPDEPGKFRESLVCSYSIHQFQVRIHETNTWKRHIGTYLLKTSRQAWMVTMISMGKEVPTSLMARTTVQENRMKKSSTMAK